jgi:hypothetical protein
VAIMENDRIVNQPRRVCIAEANLDACVERHSSGQWPVVGGQLKAKAVRRQL